MLHQINFKNTKPKRVGRGGDRGKTSGHGHKGQKARAGKSIRPALRDVMQRIPKRRGHGKNRSRGIRVGFAKTVGVNVSQLDKFFDTNVKITPAKLMQKGIVKRVKGKTPKVKLLGNGDLTKSFSIYRCSFSVSAKEKIEKVGGKLY